MEWLWGSLMAVVGALMVWGAAVKSNFVVYRLIEARARMLWKSHSHQFLLVSGALIATLGVLYASGIIWS